MRGFTVQSPEVFVRERIAEVRKTQAERLIAVERAGVWADTVLKSVLESYDSFEQVADMLAQLGDMLLDYCYHLRARDLGKLEGEEVESTDGPAASPEDD